MSAPLTSPIFEVRENQTVAYTATLQDELGNPLPATSLTTLVLTLYDITSNTIINTRDHQNVLNANGVIVSNTGVLVWTMSPDDNVIYDLTSLDEFNCERHVALFELTWAGGTKATSYDITLHVQAITRI